MTLAEWMRKHLSDNEYCPGTPLAPELAVLVEAAERLDKGCLAASATFDHVIEVREYRAAAKNLAAAARREGWEG